ncbi:MAG TPA: CoA pyrophosphatase [Candidatus Sumerlaeota bacterium]|nr:CoA pyrophosphatase [Candidatus Sumerlaeota bacterium]
MRLEHLEILKQNLPPTPGIYGRDEFLNSVVMALLIPVDGEYHFVFQKRHNAIRQGGEICFPGGGCDPEHDESLERTAIRETVEEMGIPEEKIRIIGRLDTLVMPMRAIVDAFVGVADIPFEAIRPNQKEVESIFATPVSFFETHKPEVYEIRTVMQSRFQDERGREVVLFPAREMNLPEKYHIRWESGRYKVYVYRLPEGILWGLTARIVRDIVKRLYPSV